MNIFWIWGYAGSPVSESVKNLQKLLKKHHINVYSDYYAQYDPKYAISDIKKHIESYNIDLVIGTSLGGYLALQLDGVDKIIINPCLHPEVELEQLTETQELEDPVTHEKHFEELPCVPEHIVEYYKNYIKEHDIWENFNKDNFSAAVFGKDDELLGTKYVDEVSKHIDNVVMSDQGHKNTYKSLKDSVVPLIKKYLETHE